jgi:hypothetical protein
VSDILKEWNKLWSEVAEEERSLNCQVPSLPPSTLEVIRMPSLAKLQSFVWLFYPD